MAAVRDCLWCGVSLGADVNPRRRYCQPCGKERARAMRRRETPVAPRQCGWCGQHFLARRIDKYCSRNCSQLGRRRTQGYIVEDCPRCGTPQLYA